MHLGISLARELDLGVRLGEPEALRLLLSNDMGSDVHFFQVTSEKSFHRWNLPRTTARSR